MYVLAFVDMNSKLLLLDLDGVVLRHQRLSKFVGMRATQYVQKRLNISWQDAEYINKELYSSFGHTWRGLHTEFGSAYSGSLSDYNHFVYDWGTMEKLRCAIRDPEMIRCSKELKKLQQSCTGRNIPIWIFSNAPLTWCLPVLSILSVDWGIVISPDHPLLEGDVVKPDQLAYGLVHNFIQHTIGMDTDVTFVDDSIHNLEAARDVPWKLVHMAVMPDPQKAIPYASVMSLTDVEKELQ